MMRKPRVFPNQMLWNGGESTLSRVLFRKQGQPQIKHIKKATFKKKGDILNEKSSSPRRTTDTYELRGMVCTGNT